MKGKKAVLDALGEVLTAELTAINQYFQHHALCENWGYDLLAKAIKEESIDEMRHAEILIERIMFLEGSPNLQKYSKLEIGKNVREIFEKDLALEIDAVERLNLLVEICRHEKDHGSGDLLLGILKDEEHHVGWLETQLQLLESLGEKNYLMRWVSTASGMGKEAE